MSGEVRDAYEGMRLGSGTKGGERSGRRLGHTRRGSCEVRFSRIILEWQGSYVRGRGQEFE